MKYTIQVTRTLNIGFYASCKDIVFTYGSSDDLEKAFEIANCAVDMYGYENVTVYEAETGRNMTAFYSGGHPINRR